MRITPEGPWPRQLPSIELTREQIAATKQEAQSVLSMQDALGSSIRQDFPTQPSPALVLRVLMGLHNLPLRPEDGPVNIIEADSSAPMPDIPMKEPQTILGVIPPDFIHG